jgi:hypothetical protein
MPFLKSVVEITVFFLTFGGIKRYFQYRKRLLKRQIAHRGWDCNIIQAICAKIDLKSILAQK